jgi:hypothetical protein
MNFRLKKTENGAIYIRDGTIQHRFETPDGNGSQWENLFRDLKQGQEITVIIKETKKA